MRVGTIVGLRDAIDVRYVRDRVVASGHVAHDRRLETDRAGIGGAHGRTLTQASAPSSHTTHSPLTSSHCACGSGRSSGSGCRTTSGAVGRGRRAVPRIISSARDRRAASWPAPLALTRGSVSSDESQLREVDCERWRSSQPSRMAIALGSWRSWWLPPSMMRRSASLCASASTRASNTGTASSSDPCMSSNGRGESFEAQDTARISRRSRDQRSNDAGKSAEWMMSTSRECCSRRRG